MKTNACYEVIESRATQSDQVRSDEVIRLNSDKAKADCRSAEEIAALYKQRWHIELFFKWIKQNLKIKRFLGRSENAVMIQVLVAMIAYLLVKLIQLGIRCDFSLQKIARILSLHLTTRRTIEDLLHTDTGRDKGSKEPSPQLE